MSKAMSKEHVQVTMFALSTYRSRVFQLFTYVDQIEDPFGSLHGSPAFCARFLPPAECLHMAQKCFLFIIRVY